MRSGSITIDIKHLGLFADLFIHIEWHFISHEGNYYRVQLALIIMLSGLAGSVYVI